VNKIVLLPTRFRADGEGVKGAGPEGVTNRFRWLVAQVALARIFMPTIPFPWVRIGSADKD
jgi:hypothetical protein